MHRRTYTGAYMYIALSTKSDFLSSACTSNQRTRLLHTRFLSYKKTAQRTHIHDEDVRMHHMCLNALCGYAQPRWRGTLSPMRPVGQDDIKISRKCNSFSPYVRGRGWNGITIGIGSGTHELIQSTWWVLNARRQINEDAFSWVTESCYVIDDASKVE